MTSKWIFALTTLLASLGATAAEPLRVSAIPDEAPTELQRKFAPLGDYLAKQTGREVVFVRDSDTYTARPVVLGARDAGKVEVKDGLRVGEQVVVEQSYVVKADIGKAGAAHEH